VEGLYERIREGSGTLEPQLRYRQIVEPEN